MIKLFTRLFWNVVRTRLPGPEKANRPILIIVEDTEDTTQEILEVSDGTPVDVTAIYSKVDHTGALC